MSPATELAAHLCALAVSWHGYGQARHVTRRYVRWTLIVIAYAGGRRVREEAREILRGMNNG